MEARQVFRPFPRGMGKTLIDLYRTLAARRPGWEFVFAHQLPGKNPFADVPNIRATQIDMPGADRFDLWETVRLPAAAVAARADVLHCPANTGPRFPLVPLVLTVQDLIPLELAPDAPATHAWLKRVRRAAKAARRIVCPSEYSKAQVVERLGVPAGKASVIGYAPARGLHHVSDPAELARVRAAYGIPSGEDYLFGFGASDPRKNTPRLLDAYAGLPPGLRAAARLVLIGIQDGAEAAFRKKVDDLGIVDRVTLHGFAAEADLPALLSGAVALCFPSLSEGFGLPVLDGFACRVPVLAGDRTSLPEVAGEAAVLVDPGDTESIRAGLAKLLGDPKLRERLVAAGAERVAAFTWEAAAEALAGVLEAAAGRSSEARP